MSSPYIRPVVSFKLLGQLVIRGSIFLNDPGHWSGCILGPNDFLRIKPETKERGIVSRWRDVKASTRGRLIQSGDETLTFPVTINSHNNALLAQAS